MPGFFITNTAKVPELKNYNNANCVQGEIRYKNWTVCRNVLNKYMDDKLFEETDEAIIILDGVILNKKELMQKYASDSWISTFLKMRAESKSWFENFRGVFAGAVLDKKTGLWTCFTDQCGAHLLMTYSENGNTAIGTQVNYFSDWMRLNSIERKIDSDWKNDILSYGGMRDAQTILSGVRRVYPGHYCVYDNKNGRFQEKKYYMVTKKHQTTLSDDEIIEKLDSLFHQAIGRILDKDMEYGYKTVVDISGGLDSRMNAVTAKTENKGRLFGITYAQRNSDDQKLADKVAKKLGIESQFYPMDGGNFLADIDSYVFMNGGFNYYFGITGGKSVLELLDPAKFGAEIWGLLGTIHNGAIGAIDDEKTQWTYKDWRISQRYNVDEKPRNAHEHEDNELLWHYIRGMLIGMNTGLIRQNFVEPITAYGDVEFMDFYFSIPNRKRVKEDINRKWMLKKYPFIAKIPNSRTGLPVMNGKIERILALPRRLFRGICHHIFGFQKKSWSMNPVEQWYKGNPVLKEKINQYYNDNIETVSIDEELSCKTRELFTDGNITEKLLAVTVLSAVKQYVL